MFLTYPSRALIASCSQLGAAVALTDREGAPSVLENIRGAVAANGLTPDDTTPPAVAAAATGGVSAADAIVTRDLHDAVGDTASVTQEPRVEGCESEEAVGHIGKVPNGTCSVQELSWGRVGPAEMKLAREQWCPQVMGLYRRAQDVAC